MNTTLSGCVVLELEVWLFNNIPGLGNHAGLVELSKYHE